MNSEFLMPLDVAVMTNNIPMAKMLLSNGARESPLCKYRQVLAFTKFNINVLKWH